LQPRSRKVGMFAGIQVANPSAAWLDLLLERALLVFN
jgi:hypothetical protein